MKFIKDIISILSSKEVISGSLTLAALAVVLSKNKMRTYRQTIRGSAELVFIKLLAEIICHDYIPSKYYACIPVVCGMILADYAINCDDDEFDLD